MAPANQPLCESLWMFYKRQVGASLITVLMYQRLKKYVIGSDKNTTETPVIVAIFEHKKKSLYQTAKEKNTC
jgi:hypothetical protein